MSSSAESTAPAGTTGPTGPVGSAPVGSAPVGAAPVGSAAVGSAPVVAAPVIAAAVGSAAASLTREDVEHLAHLARLDLTEAELDTYVGQLSVILDSVASVTSVAAGDIEPTTHAVPLTNVFRADVLVDGVSRQQALAGAPSAQDGRFRVPQILGEQ